MYVMAFIAGRIHADSSRAYTSLLTGPTHILPDNNNRDSDKNNDAGNRDKFTV